MPEITAKQREKLLRVIGPLLTPADLGRIFGVHSKVISRWHRAGRIPPADVKLSAKVIRWKESTITKFIENGGRP